MNTPMDESEIRAMNESFKILHERRKKLLNSEKTRKLKEKVIKIRQHSINHLKELKETAIKSLNDNGIEVVYVADSDAALNVI